MATNFVSDGDVIPYVNTTGDDIASGAVVVIGHALGVALVAIPDGGVGSVALEGVFTVPKVSNEEFEQGEKLVYVVADGAFAGAQAATGAGDITGGAIAWSAGSNGSTTCQVRLTPGNSAKA